MQQSSLDWIFDYLTIQHHRPCICLNKQLMGHFRCKPTEISYKWRHGPVNGLKDFCLWCVEPLVQFQVHLKNLHTSLLCPLLHLTCRASWWQRHCFNFSGHLSIKVLLQSNGQTWHITARTHITSILKDNHQGQTITADSLRTCCSIWSFLCAVVMATQMITSSSKNSLSFSLWGKVAVSCVYG